MPVIRACACGLVTRPTCSVPGGVMSATYRPCPVTNLRSSRTAPGRETQRSACRSAMDHGPVVDGTPCGEADRLSDLYVTGAPADVAAERLVDLGVVGFGCRGEQRLGGQHHAGRAEAALQRVRLAERLLHLAQRPARRRDALDRAHVVAVR